VQHLVSELAAEIAGHFTHEEKLMRETAYSAAAWYKAQHAHAMAQLQALQPEILRGKPEAALALLAFLSDWLRNHIPLSDRMLAAHLRNRQRALAALAS
jgi:hemerythrin